MKNIRIVPFYALLWQNLRPNLYLLMLGALVTVFPAALGSFLPGLVSLLFSLLTIILTVGFYAMMLNAFRKKPVLLKDVISRFDAAMTVICVVLLMSLLLLAAMFAALAMTGPVMFPILSKEMTLPTQMMVSGSQAIPPKITLNGLIALSLIYVVIVAVLAFVMLRFALTLPVLADIPLIKARAAMRKSIDLLKGHKRTLFKLILLPGLLLNVLPIAVTPVLHVAGPWSILLGPIQNAFILSLMSAIFVQFYLMMTGEIEIP